MVRRLLQIVAGADIENGNAPQNGAPAQHEEPAEEKKPDQAKAGAAPVKTEQGEQEVDFKTLTAEEAFQVLGVSAPAAPCTSIPPEWRLVHHLLHTLHSISVSNMSELCQEQGHVFLADHRQTAGLCLMCALSQPPQVTKDGLTSAEVEKRLAEYGPNKLPESTRNPFLVYLGYMWNPLSWAMEVCFASCSWCLPRMQGVSALC